MFFVALLYALPSLALVCFVGAYVFARLTCGRCYCNGWLGGKTALVTGANSGLGLELAKKLASRGCRVLLVDVEDAEGARAAIARRTGNAAVVALRADLASFASVRTLAEHVRTTERRLDFLVHNAGVANSAVPLTGDGLNPVMQINYLSPVLLTALLADLLRASAPGRVLFTSSLTALLSNLRAAGPAGAQQPRSSFYKYMQVYANSKAALIIAARHFAETFRGTGVVCSAFHPGMVRTPIFRKTFQLGPSVETLIWTGINRLFAKEVEEGVQTALHLILSNTPNENNGKFFADCKEFLALPSTVKDRKFCAEFMEKTHEILKEKADVELL